MTRERYRGALLGLAAGDALGTTLEFKSPGTLQNGLADQAGRRALEPRNVLLFRRSRDQLL
jgi:ADP-ribosylglycohydrolase